MERILALILSVIIAFLNLIPGLSSIEKDTISVGEWLSLANETFGMTYDADAAKLEGIEETDTYYEAAQTAYQWGILEGYETIDTASAVKGEFAAVTLVRYARLKSGNADISNASSIKYIQEVTIAVANGIFDLDEENGFFTGKLTREEALEAINKAFEIWSNQAVEEKNETEVKENVVELVDGEGYEMKEDSVVFDKDTGVEEGSTVVLAEGIYTVDSVAEENGEIVADVSEGEIADAYKSVDFSSSFEPNLAFAQVADNEGNIIKEAVSEDELSEEFDISDLISWDKIKSALLKKAKLSFNIGKIAVNAKLKEDGLTVTLGGTVCDGVYASEVYDISNLKLQTKFKANLLKENISEAYLVADYTASSVTSLNGSYAANLVENATEESADLDFFEKIKEGLFDLKTGSGNRITVYTVDIPISQIPGLVFTIDFGLELDVTGRMSLTVVTSETKGYEIINNKGRFINSTSVVERDFNINGNFVAMCNMDFILKYATTNLMDVAFGAGLGANVTTTIYKDDQKTEVEDLPIDVAVEAASSNELFDDLGFCANVKLYGILNVSVGQNSLMKKIGLKKSWTILDASNATIANLHVEESGIVKNCTRAA